MNNLTQFLPLINIFGFLVLGAAMIFTQWRLGGNKVSVDVIAAYKDRVDQLITDNSRLQELQIEQGKQITQLQADNKNKDAKILELTALIAGKDPSQIEYMQRMDKLREMAESFIARDDVRNDEILKILKSRQAYVVPLDGVNK